VNARRCDEEWRGRATGKRGGGEEEGIALRRVRGKREEGAIRYFGHSLHAAATVGCMSMYEYPCIMSMVYIGVSPLHPASHIPVK